MQEKQRAFLVRTAYWAVWAVLLWLGVRYLLRWLLPFLLALALAAAVEPVIAWCRRRMGLKRGFTAAVVTIAVTGAILALAAVIVWQLIRQAAELLGQLPGLLAGLPGMTEDLRQRLEDFCAACPQGLRSWLEEVPALLGTLAAGVAQRASGACITAAAALAAALPGVFLFCGTTALAVFFTAGSYPRVMAFFRRQLGHRLDRARGVKANLLSTLGKWCRAQAILLGVTFCELLAGFLLMGQRYALLLAAVTALVDALPVFGTGTVLLPWAAVCLLAGQAPPGGGPGGPVCGDLRRAQPSGAQGHGRPGGPASPGVSGGHVRRVPGLGRGGDDPAAYGAAVCQAAPRRGVCGPVEIATKSEKSCFLAG